jgi:hypothetical protein
MKPLSRFLLVVLLSTLVTGSSSAQAVPAGSTSAASCVAGYWDYLGCALHAGGLDNLSEVRRPAQRELRFWSVRGNMMPEHLVIVRADSAGVSGEVVYLWRRTPANDSFVQTQCAGTPQLNDAAGYCRAQLGRTVDWAALLSTLDSLGVTDLPSHPVPPDPCRQEWLDTTGGSRMVPCVMSFDGATRTIEYRAAGVYWRYGMVRIADPKSPLLPRDGAIVRLLACTALPPTAQFCTGRPR